MWCREHSSCLRERWPGRDGASGVGLLKEPQHAILGSRLPFQSHPILSCVSNSWKIGGKGSSAFRKCHSLWSFLMKSPGKTKLYERKKQSNKIEEGDLRCEPFPEQQMWLWRLAAFIYLFVGGNTENKNKNDPFVILFGHDRFLQHRHSNWTQCVYE